MRRIMDRRTRSYRPRERDYRERERSYDRSYDRRRDYGDREHAYDDDFAARRRNRRDYADRYEPDYDRTDFDDYDFGYDRDYSSGEERLTKKDMTEWKSMLLNADGSRGEHFRGEQIVRAARDMGITFKDFDEKTLCLTANMLYSDYCEVLRGYIPTDKELFIYVAMAKAFLEDEDAAVDGDEKLAAYYFAIVKGDDY